MKIVFKIIKTGSGNDVYFNTLSKGLKNAGIDFEFQYYHKIFQFAPFLLMFFNRPSDADIVHSNIEYAWALKERHKPLIATLYHLVFEKELQKNTSIFQKLFHYLVIWPSIHLSTKVADQIVTISEYSKKSFLDKFQTKKNILMIYCGIDTNVFKPIKVKKYNSDKKIHLIYVGNLIKRKGADLLPEIMRRLGDRYVLHFTTGLRSKEQKEFKESNMICLSRPLTKQLVIEYNRCDALLLPTRLEGFGYTAAEALACNIPVIASNNSSIPEVVGESYRLCKTSDVDSFVSAIKRLKINHKINTRPEIIKRFSMTPMTEEYLKLYRKYV